MSKVCSFKSQTPHVYITDAASTLTSDYEPGYPDTKFCFWSPVIFGHNWISLDLHTP